MSVRPALHPAQTPPVFPTRVEEQSPSRGLGGWAACSSLWPIASGRWAAVFSHRRATTWAVHPRGCHQQEGWAACTGFSHSSSLEQGGGEGDKSSRQAGQLSPPGSPRPALLPLTCLSLETGEALAAPPGEGAPEWPSRGQPAGWLVSRSVPASSSGGPSVSSPVQTCSSPGPIKKQSSSGWVGIRRVGVASPGLRHAGPGMWSPGPAGFPSAGLCSHLKRGRRQPGRVENSVNSCQELSTALALADVPVFTSICPGLARMWLPGEGRPDAQ